MEAGETVSAMEELAPVPAKVTVSGVEELLLVMDHVAERVPEAVGEKTRFAVQLAEAASVEPQVVEEIAKSPVLIPETPAALSVTELDVLFVTVMAWALLVPPTRMLPKDKLDGEAVTLPEATPTPERATSCGLPAALSVKAREAVRVPAAVGLKRIVTTQLADGARLAVQVFA